VTPEFDRNAALAVCFSNLKGSKNKDLLLTAHALQFLKELPEYGSNKRVGEQVGVSGEIVRQFISLLDLPATVHDLINLKKLGLEHGRRLWELNRVRPSIVEDAADAMVSMTAMETRDLVDYLKRVPSASVKEAVEALQEAKPKITQGHLICALANDSEFKALSNHAQSHGITVNDLVTQITRQWLARNDD
jgi:hypothetical protein